MSLVRSFKFRRRKPLLHYGFFFALLSLVSATSAAFSENTILLAQRTADNSTLKLTDNSPNRLQVSQNTTQNWSFSSDSLVERLYITFNTCSQPFQNSTNGSAIHHIDNPPNLRLYVSTLFDNPLPGPDSSLAQSSTDVVAGFANFTLLNVVNTVFLGVYAPALGSNWLGGWYYEIAVSSKAPVHAFSTRQMLFLTDTDSVSALLTTQNYTKAEPIPYDIYANPVSDDTILPALSNSYCALLSNPSLIKDANVERSMTTRGLGHLPKEQFLISGLNASTNYSLYLTLPNSKDNVNSGGTVYSPLRFKTKHFDNCQIIYNLDFCSEVAYAVPANPFRYSRDALKQVYDSYASSIFQNFTYSMQIITCQGLEESLYSLVRNCTDCSTAYKKWLCATTIPMCADVTAEDQGMTARPVNTSRVPQIDSLIQPGAYKEVKPCIGHCWELVQSCPVELDFQCPTKFGLEAAYGDMETGCNELGVQPFVLNSAKGILVRWWNVLALMVILHSTVAL